MAKQNMNDSLNFTGGHCAEQKTTATISWVLWDDKNQTEKRTASVLSILMSAQQQRNMEEYLEQQQLYKQHKSDTSIPSTVAS
uniref:Ovule protein n=1 Tax=Globodera pallida TaxID=36090 RepID=A0A183CG06_GLOPA